MEKTGQLSSLGPQSSGVWMTDNREAFPLRCPFCEKIVEGPARGSARFRHLVTCQAGSHVLQRVTVVPRMPRRA